jgi:hypothetical protein
MQNELIFEVAVSTIKRVQNSGLDRIRQLASLKAATTAIQLMVDQPYLSEEEFEGAVLRNVHAELLSAGLVGTGLSGHC